MKSPTRTLIRYDWIGMKQQFIMSSHSEAYAFLREEYGLDANANGAVSRQVRGWSNEKLELKREGLEKAKRQFVEMYVPSAEELANMHKAVMGLIKMMLQKEISDCIKIDALGAQTVVKMPDIRRIESIWKIIKAEKLELGSPQKTTEGISNQDRDLMKRLIDENYDGCDD